MKESESNSNSTTFKRPRSKKTSPILNTNDLISQQETKKTKINMNMDEVMASLQEKIPTILQNQLEDRVEFKNINVSIKNITITINDCNVYEKNSN
jgi:hypothetical protein